MIYRVITGALRVLQGVGSIAMIFSSIHFLKCVGTATGWSAAGYFLLAVVLLFFGFALFFNLEKALERM